MLPMQLQLQRQQQGQQQKKRSEKTVNNRKKQLSFIVQWAEELHKYIETFRTHTQVLLCFTGKKIDLKKL